MFFKSRKAKLSEAEQQDLALTLVSTGCLFILMISRTLREEQNYLILENARQLSGNSDLESLAYKLTDLMAQLDGNDPHSIIQFFQKGRVLPKAERESIAYACLICATLSHHKIAQGVAIDIFRELDISKRKFDPILHEAIQATADYTVMGYSKEHLAVKPILEDALRRTGVPSLPRG